MEKVDVKRNRGRPKGAWIGQIEAMTGLSTQEDCQA